MTERKLIPHIRFKGFENEWKDFVLGRLAKFLNGRAYKQSELLNSGKYPVLRVGNFYTNDSWYYSNLQLPEKYYAKKGDLLYTWSATFGPHIWNGNKAIYHYHIWKIELSSLLNKEFTFQLLLEDRSKLLNNTNGSTMIHLTKSEMESKVIRIPNIEEQQKIGDFFAKLDRLLGLQQQKLDQMKLLKKALLQKLFPKQDAKIPELRFKGFEGEWKTLKFLNFVEKNSQKNKDLSNTNVESISNKTGFTKQSEQFDGYRVASSDLSNYYVIKEKQFAYNPSRINVGSIAYKKTGEKESVVSPLYVSFSTKSNINNQFLWFWFKTQLFTEQRIKLSEGGVRDTLPFENLKQMHIKAPKISEQQKIGNLLAKVDHLIELENKKLHNLKQVKKSLLQNMFVE